MHFWAVVARLYGTFSLPVNTSLNCTMPALVNRRVGSSLGTRDELGTMVWPWRSKKRRKRSRISAAGIPAGCGRQAGVTVAATGWHLPSGSRCLGKEKPPPALGRGGRAAVPPGFAPPSRAGPRWVGGRGPGWSRPRALPIRAVTARRRVHFGKPGSAPAGDRGPGPGPMGRASPTWRGPDWLGAPGRRGIPFLGAPGSGMACSPPPGSLAAWGSLSAGRAGGLVPSSPGAAA